MSSRICAAFVLVVASGCITTRNVGGTELPLVDPRPSPLVCLNAKNGTTGHLTRGRVAGKPAVHIKFGVGIDFTLDQREAIDGGAVYAGEQCIHDGQVCDHFMVVETASTTFVVYRQSYSETPVPAPASSRVLVDKAVADGLITQLRGLTLDRNTRVAFAALADARETSAWVRLAGLVATAGVMTAGVYAGDQELAKAGREGAMSVVTADFSEAERPLLMSYPGLIPVLRLGPMVCIEGSPPK